MAKFIFYTGQGYTISPNGDELESLQILGIEEGQSENDALNNLFNNNEWILESNFSKEDIKCNAILNSNVLNDIKVVLDYLWKDEETHFEEGRLNKEDLSNHIFNSLKSIKDAI